MGIPIASKNSLSLCARRFNILDYRTCWKLYGVNFITSFGGVC
jgi:hypothetical protein